jgi:glycine cleavage system transcriptional repressor
VEYQGTSAAALNPGRNRYGESMQRVVLTAIGRDRPGIVAGVARVLFETGCNIEDSSMTILGGEFAMILIVTLAADAPMAVFRERFKEVETEFGLFVMVKELETVPQDRGKHQTYEPYTISVYGSDRPGIVYRISSELSKAGVNVTDVDTKRVGEESRPVYVMVLEVDVPPTVDFDDVVSNLRKIAAELSVDLTVNSAEALSL